MKRLRRRYGHAPAKVDYIEQDEASFAPWVSALVKGDAKNLCLYEIVRAALEARRTARELNGDRQLRHRADVALNAIGSGKTRDNRTACRTASAALRKYVKAWGGAAWEADVLAP
jgi:hypothetical protein